MPGSRDETLLGRIAVQANLITLDQLAQITHEQARLGGRHNLGELMLAKGLMTPAELDRLLQMQKAMRAKLAEAAAGATVAADAAVAARAADGPTPPPSPVELPRAPAVETPAAPPFKLEARIAELATRRGSDAARPLEPRGGSDLVRLLRSAVAARASDVHVHSGAPLRFRVRGQLVDQDPTPIPPERAESLALQSLEPQERELLLREGQIDFCFALAGVGRFRGNAYRQLRGIDATFRFIPAEPPTLGALGLPDELARLVNYHQGLVLVTGPARCGKTTTLAALVNLINEERAEHILTIEDPIEYLHPSRRCSVNQRSVRRDTASFARALRAALRADPDVIVIGELRDSETIALALTAAETGHLVLATLHTDSTIRTVDRLVGAFQSAQQEQVRTMLSESLRAVVSQRLLVSTSGDRLLPALEVLVVNKAVGKLIRDNKAFQISSILQTGVAQGMCLLDLSLAKLVSSGQVSREEALRHCSNPKALGGG